MINPDSGILWIGTSGIVVPGKKQDFPVEFQLTSRLNYYSSLFNTVEINSTFYKIPMLSTFEKWSLGCVTNEKNECSFQCFIKDEGRPLIYALREEYINHFMVL